MRKSLVIAVLTATVSSIGFAPNSANAVTYNRSAAVTYAERWVQDCQGTACTQLRNPDYFDNFTNDCTNYASQVFKAGGIPETRSWEPNPWYGSRASGGYVTNWTVVDQFGSRMVNGAKIATYRIATVSDNYNPANAGDAVLWDFGVGRYNHTTVEIGYSGSYWYHGNKYVGDYINQHTTDRSHSPWNLGWRQEPNPDKRRNYRAVVVHVNA